MSFFSKIHDILNKIVHAVEHIFSQENIDKAVAIAKPISDLIVFAAPYVEMMAKATAGTMDDRLVKAAEGLNTDLNELISEPDPAIRKGKILTFIGEAAKNDIAAMVTTGGTGISIGDFKINTPEDVHAVPNDLFDSAVQLAYSLFIKARQ